MSEQPSWDSPLNVQSLCRDYNFHNVKLALRAIPRPLKRHLSDIEKAHDKRQKAEGSHQLRLQHRNEDAPLCKTCSGKGPFDRNEVAPHNNTGSSFCPDHSATKDDIRNKIFGSEHTLAARKVTLDKTLKLDGD
ncbi:hypothetical protein [Absidia glauca]|uniref:Uncharacterized protein n=1 Tax=Absidia glauca TaxID=4829 RepID=A0A163JV86_ABSGL|nr:hypothetical protein [Absidia glauca]